MSPRSTGTAAYLTSWSWLRNANTAATTATAAATRTMRDTRLRGITPSLDREARGVLAFPHVKGCEATARRRQGLWFEPVPVPVPVPVALVVGPRGRPGAGAWGGRVRRRRAQRGRGPRGRERGPRGRRRRRRVEDGVGEVRARRPAREPAPKNAAGRVGVTAGSRPDDRTP